MLDARGARAELEVDGGVKPDNIGEVVQRGARVVVVGSAIFVGGAGIQANTDTLRRRIADAQAQG
jgi:ribulose-phosphate 3-epimerase